MKSRRAVGNKNSLGRSTNDSIKRSQGSSRMGKTRKDVRKKLGRPVNTSKQCLLSALSRLARIAGVQTLSTLFNPEKLVVSQEYMDIEAIISEKVSEKLPENDLDNESAEITKVVSQEYMDTEAKVSVKLPENDLDNESAEITKTPQKLISVEPNMTFLEEATKSDRKMYMSMIKQSLNNVQMVEVLKVNNPYLSAMYNLTKEEYRIRTGTEPEERILFHCTSRSNVSLISKNNLNWRKVHRSKFGLGNCFSSDADYANCHANRHNGSQRSFVICKVLIGKKQLGSPSRRIPEQGFDTLTGSRNKEIVYVKFQDNEFLPVAIVHYDIQNSTISASKYYRLPSNWFS